MSNRLANWFIAGALVSALALASPAFAKGGGGGGMGGGGGGRGGGMGMGGGMGGGGRSMGWSGGMHSGMMGPHVGPRSLGVMPMSRAAFVPMSRTGVMPMSRAAFVHQHPFFFHHRFHRFNRFAFIGVGGYGYYDDYCWRRVWTAYGPQWVNVCGYNYDYGY